MIGTVGEIARVDQKPDYAIKNMGLFKISDELRSKYLYYYLKSPAAREYIISSMAGSTQQYLSLTALRAFPILVPDDKSMTSIVSILGAIDDAIRNNSLINDYLVELATALFNEECSQANEPNSVLSDIAEVTMGQSPAGSSYNEVGEGEVFYQGRGEFGDIFPRRRLYTTEPKRMAREGDTLMSVRAPVGDLNIANERCCVGRGLAAIHSDVYQSFVHYLLRGQARQLNAFNGDGTVFGSINGKALRALPIYLPDCDVMARLEAQLEPIDRMIHKNDDEIQSLEQLRDTLLPKLMSGEIDISQVDLTQQNNHLADC